MEKIHTLLAQCDNIERALAKNKLGRDGQDKKDKSSTST